LELEALLRGHAISTPTYEQLRYELDTRLAQVKAEIAEIYDRDESRILPEIQMARKKLIAAEKSSIEQAVHDGLISRQTAVNMIEALDRALDRLRRKTK
jgi:hypothetical protein